MTTRNMIQQTKARVTQATIMKKQGVGLAREAEAEALTVQDVEVAERAKTLTIQKTV